MNRPIEHCNKFLNKEYTAECTTGPKCNEDMLLITEAMHNIPLLIDVPDDSFRESEHNEIIVEILDSIIGKLKY